MSIKNSSEYTALQICRIDKVDLQSINRIPFFKTHPTSLRSLEGRVSAQVGAVTRPLSSEAHGAGTGYGIHGSGGAELA